MSQEIIYQNLYAALGLTDSILQIWMTLTFAVVVSTYVAGDRFNRNLSWLVTGLYSLASIVQFTRFLGAAGQAFYYKELLIQRGFEPFPVPNFVSVIIAVGSSILFVAGTIGTLWFVRTVRKGIEAAEKT